MPTIGVMICNTDKLYRAMVEKKLNQRRLAAAAGVSDATIHNLFKNKTAHVDTIDAVCKALKVPYKSIILETA